MSTATWSVGYIERPPLEIRVGNSTTGELVIEGWRGNLLDFRATFPPEQSAALAQAVLASTPKLSGSES